MLDLCPELTLSPISAAKAASLDLPHNIKLGLFIQKENKMAVVKLQIGQFMYVLSLGLYSETIAPERILVKS